MKLTPNLFKQFLLVLLIINGTTLKAQTTLAAGDIAIIGYNYDANPQEMTIVTLVPISSGTVIRITDYGYDESTLTFGVNSVANAAEGSIMWTTTSSIAAGTVIRFTIATSTPAPSPPIVTGLPGNVTVTGWTNTVITSSPSPAGGDNWFIFQGSSATSVTTFIFAYANPFATTFNAINQPAGQFLVSGSGQPNNGNSYLPPSLTLGVNAIALNRDPASGGRHGDNNVYTGTRSGTKASLLASICSGSNWLTNETTAYDISAGGTNFPGTNPIFNVTVPNSAPTGLSISSNSVDENVASNSIVGSFSSTDPDVGNTFTYSLVSGTGSTDNASFNISGSDLRINASPDYEAKNTYSVRVRTTDQGSLSYEQSFNITINNLNEIVLSALSQTNLTCNGSGNGAASVNAATGGVAPYTYNWSPGSPSGEGTTSVTGLSAGTWTCVVTDNTGFTASQSFTITQPTAVLPVSADQITENITGTTTLNNCNNLLATVIPNGASPISGNTTAKVWVETAQYAQWVKRHYEITPASNAATATGRVTLYFSQSDFDAFNAINVLDLPSNPTDVTGKQNLLIEKRSGVSSNGSGLPTTYSGSIETINPADVDIVWNNSTSMWEITFNVVGFSGFFVKTNATTLPVRWISVNATAIAQKKVSVQWEVDESGIAQYSIEKSTEGMRFQSIATVKAKGNGRSNYEFFDEEILRGKTYYRIKQEAVDGSISFSSVLSVNKLPLAEIIVFPNPAKSNLSISVNKELLGTTASLVDINGKEIDRIQLKKATTSINISRLKAGIYLLLFENGQSERVKVE